MSTESHMAKSQAEKCRAPGFGMPTARAVVVARTAFAAAAPPPLAETVPEVFQAPEIAAYPECTSS
ncbi:hypothetical protein ACIQMJ_12410 [Actinosynnema sp. NPDC091369]